MIDRAPPPASSEPVFPYPAASALLLRESAAGLEVFMVLRSELLSFSSGALVFPGGKVDPGDTLAGLRNVAAPLDSDAESSLSFRVAAVRELFEETNILLARDRRTGSIVAPDLAADIERRYRKPVHDGEISIGEMAAEERLELAIDLLVPFARWITPAHAPRRFDAHFFAAACPPGQQAVHDGIEATASVWLSPRRALADAAAGLRPIQFPTRANLSKLVRHATIADVLADEHPVRAVSTRIEQTPDGPVRRIPEGLGFELTEMPADPVSPPTASPPTVPG